MVRLLRNQKQSAVLTPGADANECGLLQARRRLEFTERLLMTPTPARIRDAGLLLDEASTLLQEQFRTGESQSQTPMSELRGMVSEFRDLCSRVNALLEGAQRVQWNTIRAIGAITQSYTATARLKDWKPRGSTVNLHF